MIPEAIKIKVRQLLFPVAKLFSRLHPNILSLLGLVITCIASFFYACGIFWLAGIILLIGGVFDTIDGEVAKLTGRTTKFGAFIDSCLDRYSDFAILFGMALWYRRESFFSSVLIPLVILGAFIVSYTKARAEGLGYECSGGLGERAFRIPVIVLGSLFGPKIFIYFLFMLAIITNATGIYRIWSIWKRGNV